MTSIVIVNYNGGRELIENLRFVFARLPEGPSEVILVDNASVDGSADAAEREFPGLRIVRQFENRGYSAGVNAGVDASTGDTLVVMNPDSEPAPGSLELLCRLVRERHEFAIIGGAVIVDGRLSGNCFRALPGPRDVLREGFFGKSRQVPDGATLSRSNEEVVETQVVSGSTMALSRESFDALGPMDEDFFLYREDVEWCWRAAEMGKKVGVAPGARFEHEGGASTRAAEGAALAARVLADFHYFEKTGQAAPAEIRRLWMRVLRFRALLYGLDASLGILGRRASSRGRAAIYRILRRRLSNFEWTPTSGQAAHPSRLASLPVVRPRADGDDRPRVLFVIPDLDIGGAQRRIEYLAHGPLAARFDFEVLCLRRSGRIGGRFTAPVPVWEADVGPWTSLGTWAQVRDYCRLLKPDIIHSSTFPGDVAAWVGFRGRLPWICAKVSVNPWMTAPLRAVDRATAGRADIVYGVSDDVSEATSHLSRSGMLPRVVPNPPMIPFAHGAPRRLPEDAPVTLLSIGRLLPAKGVDTFLRTAAELTRAAPGRFRFRVVGDGPQLEELRAMAGELGLSRSVEFRGGVTDVVSEYDEADIMLLFGTTEGSPNSVLETVARGRVPLVLRVPGIEGILPAALAPCLVDYAAPEAFARRALHIVEHQDEYLARVAEAREELVRRRDRFEAAMERLFLEAMSSHAPRGRTSGVSRPHASPCDGSGSAGTTSEARVRVLHIITRLIVGGAQENTIASVARVDPERYDSRLWCGPQTGPEGSLMWDALGRGLDVRVLRNMVREISPLKDLTMLLQLVRLLRRDRFDIVHTHCTKAGILGRMAARLARVPHVTHTHHGWSFHDRMHPLRRRLFVAAEQLLAPWTRPMISVSEKTTSVGVAAGIGRREDYRLIRSGIPLDRFSPDRARGAEVRAKLGLGERDFVVGSVGRLAEQKNPMDFLRVAALVLDLHSDVTFVYVGDGAMREEVEAAANEMGITERVRLLGVRSDVPDLLRAMDVFILTSLWEGLPRVVLQALATGLPVVAFDTAGISEAVHDGVNGHLVSRGSVDEMAEHINQLIREPALTEALGLAARKGLAREFSEDGMIEELERLYGELVGGDRC